MHATTRSRVSSAVRDGVISRSRIAQPSVAAATSVAELDGDVGMASRYHLRHAGRSRDGVGSRGPGGAVGGRRRAARASSVRSGGASSVTRCEQHDDRRRRLLRRAAAAVAASGRRLARRRRRRAGGGDAASAVRRRRCVDATRAVDVHGGGGGGRAGGRQQQYGGVGGVGGHRRQQRPRRRRLRRVVVVGGDDDGRLRGGRRSTEAVRESRRWARRRQRRRRVQLRHQSAPEGRRPRLLRRLVRRDAGTATTICRKFHPLWRRRARGAHTADRLREGWEAQLGLVMAHRGHHLSRDGRVGGLQVARKRVWLPVKDPCQALRERQHR